MMKPDGSFYSAEEVLAAEMAHQIRSVAEKASRITEALQRLADEEGISFMELLRRISEAPTEETEG